jgi:hypothetical protein
MKSPLCVCVGARVRVRACLSLPPPSLCICISPPINFWMPGPIYMKLGMYTMAPDLISAAHFVHSFRQ